MTWLARVIVGVVLGAMLPRAAYSEASTVQTELCPDVTIISDQEIALTRAERALVCGDGSTRAWSDVPLAQAGATLATFLANRGYHQSVRRRDGDRLVVEAGPLSVVRDIRIAGNDAGIDVTRFWPAWGVPMTPKTLDELEAWLKRELAHGGMPCAGITTRADPRSGDVTIVLDGLTVFRMPEVDADPVVGINAGVPRRYYPFAVGDAYDGMALELASRRIVGDDIVISSTFLTDCPADVTTPEGELEVRQRLVPGAPRLVSFGIGLDTEEYVVTEASWRHARFGATASSLSFTARASFRRQRARLGFDWYYAPIVSRHFLRAVAGYDRQNERRFDSRSLYGDVGPAWTRDTWGRFFELWVGGSYRHDETTRGEGPATSDSFAVASDLRLVSHDFEFYAAEPRSGHEAALSWRRSRKGLGAEFSATSTRISGTWLFNVFQFDPPIWVLGVRADLFTTQVGKETEVEEVPLVYRGFLGGSENLRGFGRKQLPANDEGAMTTAYAGTEMRLANTLPYKLQPIAFVDFGKVGATANRLDEPLFWSPGVGLNWQSPVGTLRSTVAHGFFDGEGDRDLSHLSRWQFYLSFGEQF